MRYRTKVLILLVGTALVTNGVSVAIQYVRFQGLLFEQIRSKVLSIAATTAALLDGDLHKEVRTRADETSAAYGALQDRMRRVRDSNRRDDVYVKFVYTMRPSAEKPGVVEFGVDAEESLEDKSHVGDVYKGQSGFRLRLDRPRVDAGFTRDQWGEWLSASAPIRDRTGAAVAALGVDVAASAILAEIRKVWISALAALGIAAALAGGVGIILSREVSRPLDALRRTVDAIGQGDLEARTELARKDEFGEVAQALNAMAVGLREGETLKSSFRRYVPGELMESILQSGELPAVRGDRRRITVLFSDIRGFTAMSEDMRPEAVVRLLNQYFDRMIDAAFRNHTTSVKFLGDGLMVIFGAPADDPYQEEHAVKAALEMQAELRELCAQWEREGRPAIRIGIGINSGAAVVGNFGSTQRMEYTAIGDTVNLAARLETATKEVSADILISEYTYNAVRGLFRTTRVGPIQVKGRSDPVVVYSVEGLRESPGSAA